MSRRDSRIVARFVGSVDELLETQAQECRSGRTDRPRSDPDHTEADNYFLGAQRRAAAAIVFLISFFGAAAASRDDAQRV